MEKTMKKKRVIIDEFVLTVFSDGRIDWGGFERYFSKEKRFRISKLLKNPILALIKERVSQK